MTILLWSTRYIVVCSCEQPPMSKARLDIIDQAFNKMDKTGDGVVTVADLMNTYDVSRHPKFISGEKTKEQIIKKYLDVFQRNDTDDEVCQMIRYLLHCCGYHIGNFDGCCRGHASAYKLYFLRKYTKVD